MDAALCLREFRELARRMNIEIRYTGDGTSGLCSVRGRRVLFLDRLMDAGEQVAVFIEGFSSLDLEDCYLVPAIRRLLEKDNDDGDW